MRPVVQQHPGLAPGGSLWEMLDVQTLRPSLDLSVGVQESELTSTPGDGGGLLRFRGQFIYSITAGWGLRHCCLRLGCLGSSPTFTTPSLNSGTLADSLLHLPFKDGNILIVRVRWGRHFHWLVFSFFI